MVNLPCSRVPEVSKALRNIVQQILMTPEKEQNNSLPTMKCMDITNPQIQIALISFTERLGSAPLIYETIVNEIARKRDNWISDIGFQAIVALNGYKVIDTETVNTFTNTAELFETDNYTENLSLCLNIADILQEQVNIFSFN